MWEVQKYLHGWINEIIRNREFLWTNNSSLGIMKTYGIYYNEKLENM